MTPKQTHTQKLGKLLGIVAISILYWLFTASLAETPPPDFVWSIVTLANRGAGSLAVVIWIIIVAIYFIWGTREPDQFNLQTVFSVFPLVVGFSLVYITDDGQLPVQFATLASQVIPLLFLALLVERMFLRNIYRANFVHALIGLAVITYIGVAEIYALLIVYYERPQDASLVVAGLGVCIAAIFTNFFIDVMYKTLPLD